MDWLWVGAACLGIDPELSRGGISRSDSNQRSGPRRTTCVLGPKDENEGGHSQGWVQREGMRPAVGTELWDGHDPGTAGRRHF